MGSVIFDFDSTLVPVESLEVLCRDRLAADPKAMQRFEEACRRFGRLLEVLYGVIFCWEVPCEGAVVRWIHYAQERSQYGQPIGSFQSVSNRIADMRIRLEISRLLLYKLAWVKDQGRPAPMDAAIAKLQISEAFVANSLDAMRIHGAKGYLSEFDVERDLRDSLGGVIYSGTSDIQRNIIAGFLGL